MLKWISLLATVITWPLIAFGAIVRLKGAGLACPDWPLCYGQVIPPPGFEILLEVGHRFVAVVLGLCIILMVWVSFRNKSYNQYKTIMASCLGLVLFQGFLGGLTVIYQLWPPIVVAHLIGGNLLLAVLVYSTYRLFVEDEQVFTRKAWKNTKILKQSSILGIILLLIIISGGANSSTYSGYACEAFPGCHATSPFSFVTEKSTIDGEQLIPDEVEPGFFPFFQNEWIHMIHRLIAIIGGFYLIFIVVRNFITHPKSLHRWVGIAILVGVSLEIVVGILNAIYRVPVPVSALHTAIASSLVVFLSLSFAKSFRERD